MMSHLVGGLVFGAIGLCAFTVGKRRGHYKTLGLGLALMAYPYFVSSTVVLYLVGIGLTIAVMVFRE